MASALAATRPLQRVAFRAEFKPSAPGAWCELVKDVAALANSGGGLIVFGVDTRGEPNGWNAEHLLQVSAQRVGRELAVFIGEPVGDITVHSARKGSQRLAVVEVGARRGSPLVFEKAGTYVDREGREHRAFERGTVYFRHGPRSTPARTKDLARFAHREELRIRRDIQEHLRRVAKAPTGSELIVVPPTSAPARVIERFRVVDDPNAAVLARTDFDVTHPYRQKELLSVVNDRADRAIATAYELQCVRRVHGTDEKAEFFHRPRFGSPQYSEAFVVWLLAEHQRDPKFFEKAAAADRRR